MGLPENPKTKVIPDSWRGIYDTYTEHSAWYSGDPDRIMEYYGSKKVSGRHWAREMAKPRRSQLHVPVAGDISSMSADMLFSEAPKVRIPEADSEGSKFTVTQDRLDEIISEGGFFNRIIEGAETCSAMGGVFLKPNWDIELSPVPILSIAQVDTALPEFKWGILVAVSFIKDLENDEGKIWRLVERHEVINGTSWILNGLYIGDREELGRRVALSNHPATADLLDEIDTQIPRLAVRYVPNMRPNKKFRGISIGQSDYQGAEGLMDALDETYTSWIRDIRLGQGRILVPESFLERQSNGSHTFDIDQEIFTTFDIDPVTAGEMGGITVSQFAIRTEEHKNTSLELLDRIVARAGYSPQSFGLKIEGSAESGTALNVRERKSLITTGKKQAYWKSALEDILEMMMIIDTVHLGQKYEVVRPVLEMEDSIQQDIVEIATAVEIIHRAEAMSIETKVRWINPDWSEDQVMAEVERIKDERGLNVPDPMQMGLME